jgi:hypothetical protein
MRIGLLASDASLAEYFVTALGLANHAVTLYPAMQDLVSGLAAAASQRRRAPHEVLLLELILNENRRQALAELSGLAKELGLPIIILTTAGRDAVIVDPICCGVQLSQRDTAGGLVRTKSKAARSTISERTSTTPTTILTTCRTRGKSELKPDAALSSVCHLNHRQSK